MVRLIKHVMNSRENLNSFEHYAINLNLFLAGLVN